MSCTGYPRLDSNAVRRSTRLLHRMQGARRAANARQDQCSRTKTIFQSSFVTTPFRSIPFGSVRFPSVPFGSAQLGSNPFHCIRFASIRFHSHPFRSIHFFQSVPSDESVLSQFHSDRFHSCLFCSVLFYDILPFRSFPSRLPLKMKTKLLSTASSSDQIRR